MDFAWWTALCCFESYPTLALPLKVYSLYSRAFWNFVPDFSIGDLYFWPNIFASYLKTAFPKWLLEISVELLQKICFYCIFAPFWFPFISPQNWSTYLPLSPSYVSPSAPSWRWLQTAFPSALSWPFSGPRQMAESSDHHQRFAGTLLPLTLGGFSKREGVTWQSCGWG